MEKKYAHPLTYEDKLPPSEFFAVKSDRMSKLHRAQRNLYIYIFTSTLLLATFWISDMIMKFHKQLDQLQARPVAPVRQRPVVADNDNFPLEEEQDRPHNEWCKLFVHGLIFCFKEGRTMACRDSEQDEGLAVAKQETVGYSHVLVEEQNRQVDGASVV